MKISVDEFIKIIDQENKHQKNSDEYWDWIYSNKLRATLSSTQKNDVKWRLTKVKIIK